MNGRDGGFTLMELLVAMTLLAMLSLVLLGGMRFGVQIWQRTETAAADSGRIRAVQLELSGMLARAYPFFVQQGPANAEVAFEGARDGVSFLSPNANVPGALDRVSIGVARQGGMMELHSKASLELAPKADARERVLLKGLSGIAFAYFGAPRPGAPAQWYDSWQHRPVPPQMVRIRARFADASARWPDLVVALRLTADMGCRYDPLTRYCQGR